MLPFTERVYGKRNPASATYLVGDIGGTNSTFAFVEEKNRKISLLVLLQFQSRAITHFTAVVKQVLEHGQKKYHFYPAAACFAGAGVVSEKQDFCTITEFPWNIDAQDIRRKTALPSVLIINDFIGVAYGVEMISKKNLILLKSGRARPGKPKVILGAGTGLGKAILIWNGRKYIPLASEGGHGDAAIQTPQECALAQFIQRKYNQERVSWGKLVSGRGLSSMYQFLKTNYAPTKYSQKIKKSNYDPALISAWQQDRACRAAFDLFLRFYARGAKNLALDLLAFGGVYIAGGIVAKNAALFQRKAFIDEFISHKRMKPLLQQIPIYALTDYNIGLYGAAHALQLYLQGDFP